MNVTSGEVVFNRRWAEMRGFRPDEIQPHVDSWMSGVHPDDWSRVQTTLSDHFQGLIPEYEAEHRVRTKSGESIWVLDRGRVFARDEQGQPTRMAGIEQDITDRKRLEEELRLAEAKSSGILSVSADAIISIDDQQRIVAFNEGAEKIFGHSKAEVVGASLDVLLPERFRAVHRRHVQKLAAGPQIARRMGERGTASVGLRKDGEEFPADASISKLDVGDTKVLTVVLRDITEQKRREDEQTFLAEVGAILSSSLDYKQTLTSVAQLATSRDLADLCLVDLVEGDQWLTAVCRDPLKVWICDVLMQIPPEDQRQHLPWPVFETKQPLLIERVSLDMITSWAQTEETRRALDAVAIGCVIVVPLLAHETFLGTVAFVRSRGSRWYGLEDLHLAQALAERASLAIESGRLYRAARRAIEARDQVMGIVAHDLRNPLAAILLQAAILRRRGPEPERRSREPVEASARSASRMSYLIRDLLDVASIEAGSLAVKCDRVAGDRLVSDAVADQKSLAASASLELR